MLWMRKASMRPSNSEAPRTEKENHVRQPFSWIVPSQSRAVHKANSFGSSVTASTRAALPESKLASKVSPPTSTSWIILNGLTQWLHTATTKLNAACARSILQRCPRVAPEAFRYFLDQARGTHM
eukprot:scaffold52495_cov60-Phaeocystis_antarctica.AAC.2